MWVKKNQQIYFKWKSFLIIILKKLLLLKKWFKKLQPSLLYISSQTIDLIIISR